MKNFFRLKYLLFTFLIILSCKNDEMESTPINLSDDFSLCNSQLSKCIGGVGDYCLFGFKWGEDNLFTQSGYNATGPKSIGGEITYSFQEENGEINTHRQIELSSKSFNNILSCAKDEIRKALNSWSEIANISFKEISENSESKIKFYVADIVQSGIGYPNFQDELCKDFAGNMIIQSDLWTNDCEVFYAFALHEIGHVLGLGHVDTENIMNPKFLDFNINELKKGDKLGIIEIYGEN